MKNLPPRLGDYGVTSLKAVETTDRIISDIELMMLTDMWSPMILVVPLTYVIAEITSSRDSE